MSKCVLHRGDCLSVLPTLEPESIDTCITDPPYGLKFMGKNWDNGVPGKAYWEAVFNVLKPGGMCLAFGGTRTFHRLACAIEDAGFEIRDTIMWVYGTGFPKSHNISKGIDKAAGAEREVVGVRQYAGGHVQRSSEDKLSPPIGTFERTQDKCIETAPATPDAQLWDGWGTALKPAWEPVLVAMKPTDGTFANNALTHGVAGLNVDGGRVPGEGWSRPGSNGVGGCYGDYTNDRPRQNTAGRFPANLIHDGSEEVVGLFPDSKSCNSPSKATPESKFRPGQGNCQPQGPIYPGDKGSAARFFYCAKASKKDRGEGNTHPTVKPLALMEYLCKLTSTPTGGIVLDPFAGSGSTGVACQNIGRDFIGCEIDSDYYEIAKGRLGL
jgi:site-specific DNA-methyltransferase (adenine-specific)